MGAACRGVCHSVLFIGDDTVNVINATRGLLIVLSTLVINRIADMFLVRSRPPSLETSSNFMLRSVSYSVIVSIATVCRQRTCYIGCAVLICCQ